MEVLKRFAADEDGASLIEYTVLLAIMLVATIGTIALVGAWISDRWITLHNALP